MKIECNKENAVLTVTLEGRLDTTTSPELEAKLREVLDDDVNELYFDFGKLDYISSAGLRVLLIASKKMEEKHAGEDDYRVTVKNANETITNIFDITGFSDLFNIE